MKKMLMILFAAVCGLGVSAAEPAEVKTQENPWSLLQVGFWFDFPTNTQNSDVYGLKVGMPISGGHGTVNGIEVGWFASCTDNVNGLQVNWVYCQSRCLNGIQSSFLVCRNTEFLNGLQATLGFCQSGNLKGAQGSIVNISGDVIGLQAAAAVNVSGNVTGFQAATVTNVIGDLTGLQISLINKAEVSRGVQLGLINMAKETGVQFGLINYIEDGFLPFFPVVNISL